MRTIGRPIINGRVADVPPIDNVSMIFGAPVQPGAAAGGVPDFAIHDPATCAECRRLRAAFFASAGAA